MVSVQVQTSLETTNIKGNRISKNNKDNSLLALTNNNKSSSTNNNAQTISLILTK